MRITDILNDVWTYFKIQSQDGSHMAPYYNLLISNILKMVWTDQERPWGHSSPWTPWRCWNFFHGTQWRSFTYRHIAWDSSTWRITFLFSLVSKRKSMDKRKNLSLPRQIYSGPSRHVGKLSMITTKIIILPWENSMIPGGSETVKQYHLLRNIYRLLILVQTEPYYFQCPILLFS